MFKVGDLITISNRAVDTHFNPGFFHVYFKNKFALVSKSYDDYVLASVREGEREYTQYFDNGYCTYYNFPYKSNSLEERIELFQTNRRT